MTEATTKSTVIAEASGLRVTVSVELLAPAAAGLAVLERDDLQRDVVQASVQAVLGREVAVQSRQLLQRLQETLPWLEGGQSQASGAPLGPDVLGAAQAYADDLTAASFFDVLQRTAQAASPPQPSARRRTR